MYTPPRKAGPRRQQPKYTGKIRLRVGDTVRVITGKDKGKVGQVTRILPTEGKVVIEGINIVIKHQKPRNQAAAGQSQQTGRIELAAPMHIAKVQLVDPADNSKTTRIGFSIDADGNRTRVAKKSGGVIENA
jgi:large subunit ribosomal protein L24